RMQSAWEGKASAGRAGGPEGPREGARPEAAVARGRPRDERIETGLSAPDDPGSGLQPPVVARHEPARLDSRAVGAAGGLATRTGATQHPRARRPRGVLEVRGMAPPDRAAARPLSPHRLPLAPAPLPTHRT